MPFSDTGGGNYSPVNTLSYDPSDPRDFSPKGFGSGVPTQRGVGAFFNFLGNLGVPGLGMLTGPAASNATRLIQNWLGQRNVQNAMKQFQQGQPQGGGDSGDGTGTWGDPQVVEWAGGSGSDKPPGGFSPTGQVPVGREWWSGDFGRGELSGGAGLGPGDWIMAGPGGGAGHFGTGFGAGTVGNLATAIGFGGPYGGGGAINYGGTGWGNSLARGQMLRAMKGIYTSPGSYGGMLHANSPLNALTGTAAPSYQQFQQSQAELGNILRQNPSLLLGATSGVVPRGTPQKQVT